MKNLLNLGKALNKAEQKLIYGGKEGDCGIGGTVCFKHAHCTSSPYARCSNGCCVDFTEA